MSTKISEHLVCTDNSREESVYFGTSIDNDLILALQTFKEGEHARHIILRDDVPVLIKYLQDFLKR